MRNIDELGELAMATRLVRLSELTRKDVNRIYKEHHVDFESKWFPVFYVLSKGVPMSIAELADAIGYTHQSVAALIKEMQSKKLIKTKSDKFDGRKKIISLTPKAMDLLGELQLLWADFLIVNNIIYNNGRSLLKAVEDTEAALAEEGFYERYKRLKAMRKELRQQGPDSGK